MHPGRHGEGRGPHILHIHIHTHAQTLTDTHKYMFVPQYPFPPSTDLAKSFWSGLREGIPPLSLIPPPPVPHLM